jgi:hypothetical protein
MNFMLLTKYGKDQIKKIAICLKAMQQMETITADLVNISLIYPHLSKSER